MKPQIKKHKQRNIKSYFKHNCIKCKCHKNDTNLNIIVPPCCNNSDNICKKCKTGDIEMKNANEYNKIFVIDNELNIIKCSRSFMKDLYPADVYVHKSEIEHGGFGVFANKKFIKNEIIEIAPYIILEHYNTNNYGVLKNYVYYIKGTSNVALSLGFGSLYNCSKSPNVNFVIDSSLTRLMIFYACCDIDIHDELFINYGYDIDDSMKNNINNIFPMSISNELFDSDDLNINNDDYQRVLVKQIKKLTI